MAILLKITLRPSSTRVLFKKSAGKLEFGFGYSWRPGDSNLLLATKNP